MTLPPHRLGDHGQRYEVRCDGYPEDGKNVIGFSPRLAGAIQLGEGIVLAPGAKEAWIVDRHDNYKVVWRRKRGDTDDDQ